jgi:hypothetical protein
MKTSIFDELSIKIIMEETECNFIRDCFLDPDKDSDIFDDFFMNLDSANYDENGFQTFECEQLK